MLLLMFEPAVADVDSVMRKERKVFRAATKWNTSWHIMGLGGCQLMMKRYTSCHQVSAPMHDT